MKSFKRAAALLLAAVMAVGMNTTDGLAASRKKITSISLSISAEIKIGDDMGSGEVEVTTSSGNYTVGEYEFTNPGFEWTIEDTPELEIYLYADEGYYFSVDKDKIKFKGTKAEYVSKKSEDSSETMILTVKLSPLSNTVNRIENVTLGTDGIASWPAAAGAGSYELYLYRDGKSVGSQRTTASNTYNFANLMTRDGNYTVKVRGVNSIDQENKSGWTESMGMYVSDEQAEIFKSNKGNQQTGWVQDANGWWYRNSDGTYPSSGWQMINEKWYYFYETGYMAVGWVESDGKRYYCNQDGDMMVNGTTPDGFVIGGDGSVVE